MQTAAALIVTALGLGAPAAVLGLSWPAWRLSGAKPSTLWVAAGLVLLLAALAPFGRWSLLPVGAALIYLALTDLRRFSLPWPGLLILAATVALDLALQPQSVVERLTTGLVTALLLFSLRHWSGKPPKLGFGDVILAGLVATLVGWRFAAPMLAVAALAPLLIQRVQRREGPVPFGFWIAVTALPFAALSAA